MKEKSDKHYIVTKHGRRIMFKALLTSVGIYLFSLMVLMPALLEKELKNFGDFSNVVREQKRTIYLLGLLSESLLSHEVQSIEKMANRNQWSFDSVLQDITVYSLEGAPAISQQELTVVSSIRIAADSMPELIKSFDYFIYFRSYESKRVFASRQSRTFKLQEEFFTSDCELSMSCASHASSYSLSDRLLVSPIYTNKFNNRKVLTISTPAYVNERIIGDISVDIFLDQFDLNNKLINRRDSNGVITSVITDKSSSILGQYFYAEELVVDNRNMLVYKVVLFKFIKQYIALLVCAWLVCLYVYYRLKELKLKKNHLKQAEWEICRDELTGLYNRTVLRQDVFLSAFKQCEVAIIAIDGDNFKKINDIHGHQVGDIALRYIANEMKNVFRERDFLVRTGGDEFVVFLVGCSLKVAEKLKNDLCQRVSNKPFFNDSVFVSISAGVTVVKSGETLEDAMHRADSLLYASKNAMRKRRLVAI